MFDYVKGDMNIRTRLLPFDNFCDLVVQFNSKNVEQKIDRFFSLIDEDNSGSLDFVEILNLCRRSLAVFIEADAGATDEDRLFYENLA
jgi:Ca2+-binding EF-hand superfamily protein